MTMRHMSSAFRFTAIAASLALLLASLQVPSAQSAGKIQIVTATSDLAALSQEVGGDPVEVESIARGYQDPHFVKAKPTFLLKLRRAALLMVAALELELRSLPPPINQSS